MFNFIKREKPLLTVVIPSYNHENYIRQAVESVLNQSYHNLELIVIDDGSKDNSVPIIKNFQEPRITLVCQENRGAHNAINKGLSLAKGEYLAILNSDDIFLTDRFEIMINEMQKRKSVEFACSYIQIIDSEGKKLGVKEGWNNMEPWEIANPMLSFKSSNDFKLNLLMTNFVSTTSNFLFTRNLYEKIGGMRNLRFVHDWDFALRAAEAAECLMVEQPLMEYRIHNTNTISSDRKWMLFEIAWIWAANLDRFYNKKIFCKDEDIQSIEKIAESINTQGNDKVLWLIKVFIDAQRMKGIEHPEEILLEDKEIRTQFLKYVVE